VENKYHHNYAELGYALKDKKEPNWKDAEQALTRAITIARATNALVHR
jgi:hypothetical protein